MTVPWYLRALGAVVWVAFAGAVLAVLAAVYGSGFAAGRSYECRMGFGEVEDYPARVEYCRERLR